MQEQKGLKQKVRDSTWPPAALHAGGAPSPSAAAKLSHSHPHAAPANCPSDPTLCTDAVQIPAVHAVRSTKGLPNDAGRYPEGAGYPEGALGMGTWGGQVPAANTGGWATCDLQAETTPGELVKQAQREGVTCSAEPLDSAQTLTYDDGNAVTSSHGLALMSHHGNARAPSQVHAHTSNRSNAHESSASSKRSPSHRCQGEQFVGESSARTADHEERKRGDFLPHGYVKDARSGTSSGNNLQSEDFVVCPARGGTAMQMPPDVGVWGCTLAPPVTLQELSLIDPDSL